MRLCVDHLSSRVPVDGSRHPVAVDIGDENAAARLAAAADRLDELADTAELMGDDVTAIRLREQASRARMEAMNLIPTQITLRASE